MAAKKTVETITIKPIVRLRTKIRIVGDTPLITHAWSEKAKRQMLEDQMGGKRVKKRPTKMPFDDFARALHWITPMPTETITDPATNELREVVTEELFDQAIKDGAKFGFPANSIKLCANSAAYRMGYVKNQMALRGATSSRVSMGTFARSKATFRSFVMIWSGFRCPQTFVSGRCLKTGTSTRSWNITLPDSFRLRTLSTALTWVVTRLASVNGDRSTTATSDSST